MLDVLDVEGPKLRYIVKHTNMRTHTWAMNFPSISCLLISSDVGRP